MMTNTLLSIKNVRGTAVIVLSGEDGNPLTFDLRKALVAAFDKIFADGKAKAVVLMSAQNTLARAPDLSNDRPLPLEPSLSTLTRRMENAEIPIVAVITGEVLGAGASMALGAHYRVIEQQASIGFPEVDLAHMPQGGATQRLPRLVGIKLATQMMLSGRILNAKQAHHMKFADLLVETGKGEEAALKFLKEHKKPRPTRLLPAPCKDDVNHVLSTWQSSIDVSDGRKMARDAIWQALQANLRGFSQGVALEERLARDLETSTEHNGLKKVAAAENTLFATSVPNPQIKKIALIGHHPAANEIAAAAAGAGAAVTILHQTEEKAGYVVQQIGDSLHRHETAKKLTPSQVTAGKLRLSASAKFSDIEHADVILLSSVSSPRILKAIGALTPDHIPIVVPMDYYRLNDLDVTQMETSRLIWCGTGHFADETHDLIEIRPLSDHVSADSQARMKDFCRFIQKIPIWGGPKTAPVLPRLTAALWQAAEHLIRQGASPYQVDKALEAYGFTEGPFSVQDRLGYKRARAYWAAISHNESRPTNLFARLMAGGLNFHCYDDKGARVPPTTLHNDAVAHWRVETTRTSGELDETAITDYCITALQNVACHLLSDPELTPEAVDIAAIHATGFPRWRGGPLFAADTSGVGKVLMKVWSYAAHDRRFWRAAPKLEYCVSHICNLTEQSEPQFKQSA